MNVFVVIFLISEASDFEQVVEPIDVAIGRNHPLLFGEIPREQHVEALPQVPLVEGLNPVELRAVDANVKVGGVGSPGVVYQRPLPHTRDLAVLPLGVSRVMIDSDSDWLAVVEDYLGVL